LAAFGENLLTVRLDAGERKKLVFEGFAISRRVYFYIVFLALMFYEYYKPSATVSNGILAIESRICTFKRLHYGQGGGQRI
jgi:hypothetical protein